MKVDVFSRGALLLESILSNSSVGANDPRYSVTQTHDAIEQCTKCTGSLGADQQSDPPQPVLRGSREIHSPQVRRLPKFFSASCLSSLTTAAKCLS